MHIYFVELAQAPHTYYYLRAYYVVRMMGVIGQLGSEPSGSNPTSIGDEIFTHYLAMPCISMHCPVLLLKSRTVEVLEVIWYW
jgi:hypothetical protein